MKSVFWVVFAVVCVLCVLGVIILQDSPRNMIIENKITEAMTLYENMFKNINITLTPRLKTNLIKYISQGDNELIKFSSLKILFKKNFLLLTILNIIIWAVSSALFYGILIILNETLKDIGEKEDNNIITSNLILCGIGIVLLFLAGVLSEFSIIGLKKVALIFFLLSFLFSIGLSVFTKQFSVLIVFYVSLVGTGFSSSLTIAIIVYPTKIRDIALGFFSFCNSFGVVVSQFLYYGLFKLNVWLPYYINIFLNLVVVVSIYLLPKDCTNIPLDYEFKDEDMSEENEKENEN